MGTKRGQGRGSFVTSVVDLLDTFYGEVVESMRPWSPPKLREQPVVPDAPAAVEPDLVSTALSSQDGAVLVPTPAGKPSIETASVVPEGVAVVGSAP